MREVNVSYYQQLLDKGRFSISDRTFYQKILTSVKKQNNKATERQYNILQQIKFGKLTYSPKNEHMYNKNTYQMNQNSQLRQLIRESIQEYIKEIDEAGDRAALEAKIEKTQEAIENRKKKINMEGLDEAYHDMMDKSKIKELTSEIKMLEKSLTKYGKMLEKMDTKSAPKKMEDEGMENEEMVDEVNLDEYTQDPESGPGLEEDSLNEEQVLYMQKIAGIISETEYTAKLEEAKKKKPSAGMTKKEKSALSKKAHAGKDIGKKGKGFEKVAKAAEKQYGSKEAGEKVAAAAMWKAAAKK